MTPPPSDADKPGPGGRKPSTVPPKAPEPVPAKPAPKLEVRPPTPPVGGANPAAPMPTRASEPGSSPSPVPTPLVATPRDGSGPTADAPQKPADDPVTAAKPADPRAEPGRPGPASAGPIASAAGGASPKPASPASAPPKSDAAGAAPKIEPSRSDPAEGEPSKPDPIAAGPAGVGPTAGGPQAGARAGGPAAPAGAALTDGPIIDLKAKRVPGPTGPVGGLPGDAAKDSARGPTPAVAAASVKSEPAKPAPPPMAGKARGGFGSIAAAGLIGGVVGAGLLFAVGKSGLGGGNDGAGLAALDQKMTGQVSSIDRRIAGLAPRDALTGLGERIAAAEATAKQALDKVGTVQAQGVAVSPAEGQGSGQASGQGSVSAPAVPADLMARLDSLDQRVSALQEEPARDQPADSKLGVTQGAAPGEDAKPIAALDARLKALEGDTTKASAADLERKIASLQGEAAARTKADAEADAALGQRLDGLQQALDARTKAAAEAVQAATLASRTAAEAGQAQATEASKAVERRLQEQSETIAGLDKSIAQRAEASTVQAALRVVVADRVAAALASGTPYAEPLATLRRLDPGAEAKAAALAPFAETGAPTAGQLADAFRPIAEKIASRRRAARAQNAAETGDFRAKLLSMADGLVQVRKVDAPAPEAAADPEGKVRAALDRGDLPAASAAFAALPPEARGEAGDFGPRLMARAQAGEAARAVVADAFKALPTPAAIPAPASIPASAR